MKPGFIRLSSSPAVVGVAKSPGEAAGLFAARVRSARLLTCDVGLRALAASGTSVELLGVS